MESRCFSKFLEGQQTSETLRQRSSGRITYCYYSEGVYIGSAGVSTEMVGMNIGDLFRSSMHLP